MIPGASNTLMTVADAAHDSQAVFPCPYAGAVRLGRESANTIPARGISGRVHCHVTSSRRQGSPLVSGLVSRSVEQDMQSDKITRRAALGAAGGALALSVTTLPAMAAMAATAPVDPILALITEFQEMREPGGVLDQAYALQDEYESHYFRMREKNPGSVDLHVFSPEDSAWGKTHDRFNDLLEQIAKTAPRTNESAIAHAKFLIAVEDEQICYDDAPLDGLRSLLVYLEQGGVS
jgi:hypothetical protein